MEWIVETFDLTRRFNGLIAVDSLSIKVKKGEIFGLLGPNGAGKTTLINCLSTLLKIDEGRAFVNGFDVMKEPSMVRKSIGLVFQDPSLDTKLTGKENLEMHARLYGMSKEKRKERVNEVLQLVELEDRASDLVETYSGGMRRRLEIARGLMHFPKVLFLDEPTLGLDPQTREHIWTYIKKLNEVEDVTILLTTHYMEEADHLCNRVAIIDLGKIIALDTPENLKNSLGGDVVRLNVNNYSENLVNKVKELEFVKDAKNFDKTLTLTVEYGERVIPKILDLANSINVEVESVSLQKPTLNDVFLSYTGRSIREEEKLNGKDRLKMWGRMRMLRRGRK